MELFLTTIRDHELQLERYWYYRGIAAISFETSFNDIDQLVTLQLPKVLMSPSLYFAPGKLRVRVLNSVLRAPDSEDIFSTNTKIWHDHRSSSIHRNDNRFNLSASKIFRSSTTQCYNSLPTYPQYPSYSTEEIPKLKYIGIGQRLSREEWLRIRRRCMNHIRRISHSWRNNAGAYNIAADVRYCRLCESHHNLWGRHKLYTIYPLLAVGLPCTTLIRTFLEKWRSGKYKKAYISQ
jgi:hypothetical protein